MSDKKYMEYINVEKEFKNYVKIMKYGFSKFRQIYNNFIPNLKMIKWLDYLIKLNNSSAQYIIAYMYHDGLGVKQDYKKAFELYTLSVTDSEN